jgi:hypothetical protein
VVNTPLPDAGTLILVLCGEGEVDGEADGEVEGDEEAGVEGFAAVVVLDGGAGVPLDASLRAPPR